MTIKSTLTPAQRELGLEMLNKGGRDVRAMLKRGHHPFQVERISGEMLQVVPYPCGRPNCPTCGGKGH